MCACACACACTCTCVKQANLVLITLYLFHQCCALAYFHSYKFTTLPSVVIDDPLILAHLRRLWARKEVTERQWHHFTAYNASGTFHVLETISGFEVGTLKDCVVLLLLLLQFLFFYGEESLVSKTENTFTVKGKCVTRRSQEFCECFTFRKAVFLEHEFAVLIIIKC